MKNQGITHRGWLKDDLFRRLFKNAGTLLSGNVAASALGLVSTALTARVLGPETFGILVLITTYALVVDKLVNFQSWQAIIKYGADTLESNRDDDFGALIRFGFFLDGGTAVLGTIVAAAGAWFVGQWRGWDAEVVLMATLYSGTIIFHVSGTPIAILRLFNKFKLFSFQVVIASAIKLFGVSIAFAFGAGLWVFLVVWALTDIVGKMLLIVFSIRELSVHEISWVRARFTTRYRDRFPKLWTFVLTTNLNSSVRMASREVDVFVIGALLSPEAVGLFKIAKQISSLLAKLSDPLYQSIYPELARLRAAGDTRRVATFAIKSAVIAGSAALVFWVGTVVLGRFALGVFFGSEYVSAYAILVWYMMAIVIAILAFPLQPLMLSYGRPDRSFWIHIIATGLYFTLLVPLAQLFDAVGAAQAYLGYYVVWSGLMIASLFQIIRQETDNFTKAGQVVK